tara:strand:- start:398 stop:727 length:330 start_codon:yes stop_codon:yes gene_type:complete
MGAVDILAYALNLTCGVTIISFTLISSASRDLNKEKIMQQSLQILFIIDMILLILFHASGASLWGSKNIALPLAVICFLLAISARLNLQGEQISQGANPHSINKKNDSK